jgi:hypothetical protein
MPLVTILLFTALIQKQALQNQILVSLLMQLLKLSPDTSGILRFYCAVVYITNDRYYFAFFLIIRHTSTFQMLD